jgi:hypothetical protein
VFVKFDARLDSTFLRNLKNKLKTPKKFRKQRLEINSTIKFLNPGSFALRIWLILNQRMWGESSWGFSYGECAETRQTENPKNESGRGKKSLVSFVTSFQVVWLKENVCVF